MGDNLAQIAQQALEQSGSASAVIFLLGPDGALKLAAVAGLEGEPLNRLLVAVQSPNHPIARTATNGAAEFDVTPMAPGGPALRSHMPLIDVNDSGKVVGVLALAHQQPLTAAQRRDLQDLLDKAVH